MISNIQNKHQLVKINGIEYYTIEGMEEVHKEMLRLLKIIDKIATENSISYWISAGSMIGVARHHGFIPWDDDLDIDILKHDYIKLVNCLTEYSNTHNDAFIFFPAPQDNHCCNYFASNKCFLRAQGSPSVYPAKVDIRPYNCIKRTEENIKENKKLQDIANYLVFGKKYGFVNDEELTKINRKEFFKSYNLEYGLYDYTQDDAVFIPPYFEYARQFDFEYKHLFPITKKEFEDIQVSMPKDYDYILTSLYGDYMKLPKLYHRVPAACEVYNKTIPINKLKQYYSHADEGSLLRRRINKVQFLVSFHGIFDFIKYKFFEKRVGGDSNYEDVNNW